MKKIDSILNGTKEQYPSLISKLSNILEPFALLAVGKAPVYVGRVAGEMGVKQCKECGAYIFSIEGSDVALVDTEKMQASVFGGEMFAIQIEDVASVQAVISALEAREDKEDENPLEALLNDMPKELKTLLGAAAIIAKRRRGDN